MSVIKSAILAACLLASLSSSLWLKSEAITPNEEGNQSLIPHVLEDPNLIVQAPIRLTRHDNRDAHLFHMRDCHGSLVLHAIERNSEDANLLSQWGLKPIFHWQGHYSSDFPHLSFWFYRGLHKIGIFQKSAPKVWAMAEIGQCNYLARHAKLSQIEANYSK